MPRQLAAEQTVASYESSKLDVQIANSKAQQDLSQADRDIVELKAKFRTGVVSEASDVRARLDSNAQHIQTARGLLRQAEMAAPGLINTSEEPHPSYAVIRASDGTTVVANENDAIEPGDIVRVTLPMSRGIDAELASSQDRRATPSTSPALTADPRMSSQVSR